jgi:hypothetical protein
MTSSSALRSNIGSSQIASSNSKLSLRQNSPFDNRISDIYNGPSIPFKIKIRTGDGKDCGISSNVFIRLFGETKKQRTDKIMLRLANKKRFEPGSAEIFQIEGMDIGNLTQVEVNLKQYF